MLGAGCTPSPPPGVPTAPLPTTVATDRELADRVPYQLRNRGVLDIGTDPPYRPMEYLTSDGRLTGVDVHLAQAIAAKLHLAAAFSLEAFSALTTGVRVGRFDLGVAALSVSPGESLPVDAVLYLESGTRLVRSATSDAELDDLCGRAVGALEGSAQVADLAAASIACTDAGREPITVRAAGTVEEVARGVLLGNAEALVADSPVAQSIARDYPAELEVTGDVGSPRPLAMLIDPAVPGLADLVADALDALIADGSYDAILAAEGVVEGAAARAIVLRAGDTFDVSPLTTRTAGSG